MLTELCVENLLLIERARLALAPGLTVLTGETGAGKTVLAHALDLLLGGRARAGIVRPGAAEAYVEGSFELSDALRSSLGDRLAPDAEELVLARRVSAEGRTRASINGRSCPVGDLREVAAELIAFYGQHEHRRLTLASAQLELLDAACGPGQSGRLAACAAAAARLRTAERSRTELRERAGARERELDLLRYELAEIEAAEPSEAEEAELLARRDRLRHLEALQGAAHGGLAALSGEDEDGGALLALGAGGAVLDAGAGLDPALDALAGRWQAVVLEAQDLAAELRAYAEGLDEEGGAAAGLQEAEERLTVLDRLKRKHGGTVAAVLEHAARCRERRDELLGAEEALQQADATVEAAREALAAAAAEVGAARRAAAPVLADAVRERLRALAMEGATFEIGLEEREPGPTGADAVEFRIAANPGVPPGPLREIASGGELSRVMLALAGAASEGSGAPAGGRGAASAVSAGATLVFDEVDAGIGGVTARAVGEQLRGLAASRQVICITHLPQIASLGAAHFSIAKDVGTEPARTSVTALAGKEVVAELVRMLGADADDVAARRHAKELLKAA